MRIALINPNSTEAMNAAVEAGAARIAAEYPSLMAYTCCVEESPALINSDVDEVRAAYWTLQKAQTLADSCDGFVIACHSDPAVGAVSELTGKPTCGIGYASLAAAAKQGGSVGILIISEKSAPRKLRMIRRYGFNGKFTSYATGYSESMKEGEVIDCLMSAAQSAIADGVKTLVLGCAGMGLAAPALRDSLYIPVIDGTEEALRLLLALNENKKEELKPA